MNRRGIIYFLTALGVAMSLGHHLDHVIRANAIGWPLTAEVNAFTMSLGVYPVLATALLLYKAGRVGPGLWALVSGGGAAFVSVVHFGPMAVEPAEMVHGGHDSTVAGWIAFGWLVTFVGVLIVACVYEAIAWYGERQDRGAGASALAGGTES